MPVIGDHFLMCPVRTPVDPGKGSRGNSKVLPNSDELERPARIMETLLAFSSNP